jgi:hypothetical protein
VLSNRLGELFVLCCNYLFIMNETYTYILSLRCIYLHNLMYSCIVSDRDLVFNNFNSITVTNNLEKLLQ